LCEVEREAVEDELVGGQVERVHGGHSRRCLVVVAVLARVLNVSDTSVVVVVVVGEKGGGACASECELVLSLSLSAGTHAGAGEGRA
jgi:hypothetical protein